MNHASYRDTWVEISLDAIQRNVKAFKQHIRAGSNLMAVVKADGYGHGAVEVARAAVEAGADYLAVALLDEAIELRDAGITEPLLVLGYTKPAGVKVALENEITLTVFSTDSLNAIAEAAEELQKKAKIHVKIDTGMMRIGIQNKEAALAFLKSIPSNQVEVEGIFTHFADADHPDDDTYTRKQFKDFLEITSYLEENGFNIPVKHCCNSAATIAYPEMHMDMCRVGVSIYGLYPSEHLREIIPLTQAMTFKTKPVMLKQVEASQAISYGCTFLTDRPTTVATIPVGYADGFSRSLSNRGSVTTGGKRAPIIGRICMDQSMIDVTDIADVDYDSELVIFGDPGTGAISLGEVADLMNTIHYEVACLIGKRVTRVYVKNNEVMKEIGLLR